MEKQNELTQKAIGMVDQRFEEWWGELPDEMKDVDSHILELLETATHTAYLAGTLGALKVVDEVLIKPLV